MAEATTLAILVPEAEKLVGSYRARHDRSGAEGMPAHITLLWPFKPVDDVTAEVRADIEAIAAAHSAFRFALTRVARFDQPALYLAPEPEEPFRALMHDIWTKYPEHPPYGGQYEHNPPHLTVAQIEDPNTFERIEAEFTARSAPHLPLTASAERICLMERHLDRWRRHAAFELSAGN